jgi:hypothetical protein
VITGAILAVLAMAFPAHAQYPPQEPTCQVSKTVVAPGESIQVSGDNWEQSSAVEVRFRQDPHSQEFGPFPTDADGSFSATITIPIDAEDGPARIVVGGPDQDGKRTRCFVEITVDSGGPPPPPGDRTVCEIDDVTPAPGQTVKVSGRKWLEKSTVDIEFVQDASSEPMGTANVNGAGRFGKHVPIPEDAQDGSATVRVTGQDESGDPTECRIEIVVTSSSTAAGFALVRPVTPASLMLLLGTALVILISRRRHARALLRLR